jgi:transposase
MGYTAWMTNVSHFIGHLRKDSGTARSFKQVPATSIYAWTGERTRTLTDLHAARLLVSREEKLQEWQKEVLRRLGEVDEEIETTTKHVHRFVQMVRQLQRDHLDAWLEGTERLGTAPLRAFALSLRKDYQAVKARLTHTWSNGPTEAQIQRLKLLKRQISRQAGFALLRQRVLPREAKLQTRPRKSKRVQQLAA